MLKSADIKVAARRIELEQAAARVARLEEKLMEKPEGREIIAATYQTYNSIKREEKKRREGINDGKIIRYKSKTNYLFNADLLVALAKTELRKSDAITYERLAIETIAERIDHRLEMNYFYRRMSYPEEKVQEMADQIKSRIGT
jgi:hypothetical protein